MSASLLALSGGVVPVKEPSIASSLGHMAFGLVVVVGAIFAATKLLKAVRGGAVTPRGRSGGGIEVLSRHSLGKGLQLAVVRFKEKEVLVGISGQTISFFEAPGDGRAGALAAATPVDDETTDSFSDALVANLTPRASSLSFARSAVHPALAGATSGRGGLLERLRDATSRS